jgi:hypothetical protein
MGKLKLKLKKKQSISPDLDTTSLDGRPKKSKIYRDRPDGSPCEVSDPKGTFDQEKIEMCADMIRKGASRADACRFFGTNPEVMRKALRRHPIWETLIERAEVDCKLHHLSRVHGAEKEWKASAWFLSRKWWTEFAQRTPDSYSKEQVMTVLLSLGRVISEEINDAETRRRVLDRIGGLTSLLDSLKTKKGKSDTTYDGDG